MNIFPRSLKFSTKFNVISSLLGILEIFLAFTVDLHAGVLMFCMGLLTLLLPVMSYWKWDTPTDNMSGFTKHEYKQFMQCLSLLQEIEGHADAKKLRTFEQLITYLSDEVNLHFFWYQQDCGGWCSMLSDFRDEDRKHMYRLGFDRLESESEMVFPMLVHIREVLLNIKSGNLIDWAKPYNEIVTVQLPRLKPYPTGELDLPGVEVDTGGVGKRLYVDITLSADTVVWIYTAMRYLRSFYGNSHLYIPTFVTTDSGKAVFRICNGAVKCNTAEALAIELNSNIDSFVVKLEDSLGQFNTIPIPICVFQTQKRYFITRSVDDEVSKLIIVDPANVRDYPNCEVIYALDEEDARCIYLQVYDSED